MLTEEEFKMDWSATDGVESAGSYMLPSPALYIVTLAIVSLIVLTWLSALIESALGCSLPPVQAALRSRVELGTVRRRWVRHASDATRLQFHILAIDQSIMLHP
jgi:hypothetical protein